MNRNATAGAGMAAGAASNEASGDVAEAVQDNSHPDYFSRVNPTLLALLPRHASSVLEIGCGSGALGRAFKTFAPNARYVGVEFDSTAAGNARRYLDQVVHGDVESLDPATLIEHGERFDALVFGDVLEHLRDPWQTLSRLLPLLADDGEVLACVPNVQHWSVLLGLLRGQWRYAREGLLDQTHLRFFTLEGVESMFLQAGLVIHDIRQREGGHVASARQFAELMQPVLASLQIDPVRFASQTAAIQYVVRAGRRKASPLLLQVRTLSPVGGVNALRIDQPNRCLATVPGLHIVQKVKSAPALVTEIADKVMLFQRPILTRDDIPALDGLRRAGYLLVTEFDDHPMRWPAIAGNDYLNFRGVHAVQTSTPVLADFLREFNPEIAIFPNQIEQLDPLPDFSRRAGLTLFFGALNREADWAPILPALNRVLADHPGVRFEVVHDRKFFDALPLADKHFHPTCDYAAYRRHLARADIALLPLEDNEFNRMKSDLKFIEAAAAGAVVIASSTVYAASLVAGETGLLYDGEAAFEAALRRLLDQPETRRRLATAAYDAVRRERMLADRFMSRLDWYRALLARREALDRPLDERMTNYFGRPPG